MKAFSRLNNISVFFIIAISIFIAYGNTLFNQFVYDDGYLIVNNPFIKDFQHLPEAFTKDVTQLTPFKKDSGYYRPLSMAYLFMGYKLWHLNPMGWHLGNILLHLLNSFLVFLLVRFISKNRGLSFLAGLFFALHPIHVEAVAPIYNFMGLLATFFVLKSFVAFVKSDGMKKFAYGLLALIMYLLAVLAKEEVFIFPAIFVLYDYYFISHSWRKTLMNIWRYGGFFLIAIGYLFLRWSSVERGAALGLWHFPLTFNVEPAASGLLHILTVCKLYVIYIYRLILPVSLSAFYMIPAIKTVFSMESLVSLMICGAVFFLAWEEKRKRPLVSFFIWFFFLSSLMISNLIPIGGLFAERFMYLPSLSFCFLLAYFFIQQLDKAEREGRETRQKMFLIALLTLLILYGMQTATRNYTWRSNISLWEDTVKKAPLSYVAHLNLANAYYKAELYRDALNEYQKALHLSQHQAPYIYNAIGKIYGIKKDYPKALEAFGRTVEMAPGFVEGYYNLGITHFYRGDNKLALGYFTKAANLAPEYPWSYYGLGLVWEKKGDWEKAKVYFQKALDKAPNFSAARQALQRLDSQKSP